MTDLAALEHLLDRAERIVFFGGAGVSTESGIPDFRGQNGRYTNAVENAVPPETLLHIDFFLRHPDEFFRYYRTNMLHPNAVPNPAHTALAKLERAGKLLAVITQNIDGLHQKAGSERVIELHGSAQRNFCIRCGMRYDGEALPRDNPPRCACGGLIRPDVVLYGEALDDSAMTQAQQAIRQADVLLVGGTSLTVYPAASLVRNFRGRHLILINQSPTPYDGKAEMVIRAPIGEVLSQIIK